MFNQVIKRYNHPVIFYSLSTLIPWSLWFYAAHISHLQPFKQVYLNLASSIAFIGLVCPMLCAFILMTKSNLKQDLMGRIFNFRSIHPFYIISACLFMLSSILLAQLISLFFGYSAKQFMITGHFSFSSGVFPVWFLLILAPLIEEFAWHSYGTDCLRNKFNLFKSSLIFGVFWAIWHIPLSLIKDYYQSNLVQTGWIYGVNFLVSIIPYVLIMNWLYYKSHRNILIAVIFHISAGYFNEIFATNPDSKIIQTVLLTIVASGLVYKEKKFFFES